MEQPQQHLLARRRSSALEAERAAVEKQVEEDHRASLVRRRSSYLPPAVSRSSSEVQLRDAKKAIQVRSSSMTSCIPVLIVVIL